MAKLRSLMITLSLCFLLLRNGSAQPLHRNNTWYSLSPASETVFIFVHGIFSDSNDCWTSPHQAYWPEILKKDNRFGAPGIFLGGYYTNTSSGLYRLSDASFELFSYLSVAGPDGSPAPLERKNIVFVAHSTGGLVVRHLLTKHADAFQNKAVGLVLLASPSRGSAWANRLRWLRQLYHNRMAGQLERDNDFVMELDANFADLVNDKALPRLAGIDMFENRFIIPGILWNTVNVVNAEDSASYFGSYKRVPNSDHFSIAKPDAAADASHQFLWQFFHDRFLPIAYSNQRSQNYALGAGAVLASTLPSSFLAEVHSAPGSLAYYSELTDRGNLSLNGTELVFQPQREAGRQFYLSVNELTLTAGARIVTNGATLNISVAKITVSGGSILSFTAEARTAATGSVDAPGANGANGGKVQLTGVRVVNGLLVVSLGGQNGGPGGAGSAGKNGHAGGPGRSGSDHLLDCAHGPGDGEPGGAGEDGRTGGRGGDAGGGGILSLLAHEPLKIATQISIESPAGEPGPGGPGGPKGAGGAGGPRGSQTTYCHGGSPGANGADGRPGATGSPGGTGSPGRFVTSVLPTKGDFG